MTGTYTDRNMIRWLEIAPGLAQCHDRAYGRVHENAAGICPSPELTFRALELIAPENIRVVLLGQDPYHVPGKASGLAFGYHPEYAGPIDSSLMNIMNEVGTGHSEFDTSLEHWARQGVLLLNTRLTVEEGKPMSHSHIGWELEVFRILRLLDTLHGSKLVWLSWGREARSLINDIDPRGVVIRTSHPCKFSHMATSQPFTGSKCFLVANAALSALGQEEIKW